MNDEFMIPDEIKEKLSDDFYAALWDELIEDIGDEVEMTDDNGVPCLYNLLSIYGLADSFATVCRMLSLDDLSDYYFDLCGYDGDRFDEEIAFELEARFIPGAKKEQTSDSE